ncbi:MAG: cysteine desulfurase [Bacteroidales bacterium]|jgi:cysteine desulfurase/selenocysteine lyase|nr:cysteine desulfurase [Bacteroidales bacterium]
MKDFDISKIRSDFPILSRQVHNRPIVYFDNAATTQKPIDIIERVNRYYEWENANIHRGAHFLANEATEFYEAGRSKVAEFINAKHAREIIFTRGTTESINLVAFSFSERYLLEGDEVVITAMEHHANIVPWQMACERKKAKLKVLPMDKNGILEIEKLPELLTERTKIVAVTHISNVLGTINPIKNIIETAHQQNIPVLIDGAQSVPHQKVDVQALDCDFFCFSGHKMYAPMGIGVLYGKEHYLNEIPPYQGGGEMIRKVTFEKTTYNDLPFKFEAGTPDVGGVLALHAAIDYMENIGLEQIAKTEHDLLKHATEKLQQLDYIEIIGNAPDKSGLISFLMKDIHPYDAGTILDQLGFAVRTGHHCAEPIMDFFNITSTIRISFSFYNTTKEIDNFIVALERVRTMLL